MVSRKAVADAIRVVLVACCFAVLTVNALDSKEEHGHLIPPRAPWDLEPRLPADRDARATEALMRLLEFRDSAAGGGALQTTTFNPAGAPAAGGANAGVRINIRNDAPQPLPPGKQEISLLPGGERTFWILFTIICVVLLLVLVWCCRDLMLRPIVGCCEVSGYWLYRIVSTPLFFLWEILKVIVYPMKQGVYNIHEALQVYLHPATKV